MKKVAAPVIILILLLPFIPLSNAKVFAEVMAENDRDAALLNDVLFNTWKGNGEFIYVIMPSQNEFAMDRMKDYNASRTSIFLNGGYKVVSNANELQNAIKDCEERGSKVNVSVKAQWLECPCERGMWIEVRIKSMKKFEGILRVYVVEISSRWKNRYDGKYHFSFLEFADIENVTVEKGEEYYTAVIWDTKQHYPDIYGNRYDNVAVIAAVFEKEWHIGYTEPDKKPFKAHYLAGVAMAMPQDTFPYISIKNPKEGFLYIFGREIFHVGKTIIIGSIDVMLETWDDRGIEKIELYRDGEFAGEIGKEFTWNGRGWHSIEVVAYDGIHEASDELKALLL